MSFYVSIFENSRIVSTMPGPDGKLMGGAFELDGRANMVLNGGPMYSFTPAMSLFVKCETFERTTFVYTANSAKKQGVAAHRHRYMFLIA